MLKKGLKVKFGLNGNFKGKLAISYIMTGKVNMNEDLL